MKNQVKILSLILFVFLLFISTYLLLSPNEKIPTQVILVAGLQQPVEILMDNFGVPHIYAANEHDVFFAQGFNIARDRLFQIDFARRRGLGQLSEIFGQSYLAQDKATRLFLYRGEMQQEWESYPENAKNMTTQFVSGINAYIDFLAEHPSQLPFEFKKFNYPPTKWTVDDVVRIRSHVLTHNLIEEVNRAHVTCKANLETDSIRLQLQPAWKTQIPEGLDPCLPENVLEIFFLATSSGGSNAWVIAPEKSTTGRAVLASDPHRAYSVPSLRYIAHLHTPTFNMIGAGEPGLPAVSIGHNGHIAFALTYFSIDQEDLYVYELNPQNLREYFYNGQWQPFEKIEETILIRDENPNTADLFFSEHGPVIYFDDKNHRAYAVRAAWLLPGMAPYFASIGYVHAKNFSDFKNTAQHWGAPPENLLYADVDGNIGWVIGGKAPIRPNWDGLLPVPGDGRYEWAGFWSFEELPSLYNPTEGFFASANEMNMPADYPYQKYKLGFEWIDPFRYQRIHSVLQSLSKVSIEDSMKLQNDIYSIPAKRLLALLQPLTSTDVNQQQALALLKNWDGYLHVDSAEAALHEVWFSRHLGFGFKKAILSEAAADTFSKPDINVMLNALENPDAWFGASAREKRDHLLLQSLGDAYQELIQLLGQNPSQWQWGQLLHNQLEHPLSSALNTDERETLNIGPLPKGGSAYTPNMAAYRSHDFRQMYGASVRIIVDVGDWNNSRAINFPGQSGDPESDHYRDLVPLWQNGEYFPLLYTREAVEAETKMKIELMPINNTSK